MDKILIKFRKIVPRKLVSFIALVALFGSFNSDLQAQMLNEDSLKANYLVGFINFLHWNREGKNPIVIGIVGNSTLEREINSLIARKKASGASRTFQVIIIDKEKQNLTSVDVLFLPEGSRASWDEIIPKAMELGILTVGDSSGFLKSGGLIEFVIRKNRLRFSLNLEVSEDYQIGISSKLAHLAVTN